MTIFESLWNTHTLSHILAGTHLKCESIEPSIYFKLHYDLFKNSLCNNFSLFLSFSVALSPSQSLISNVGLLYNVHPYMHILFWICVCVCAFGLLINSFDCRFLHQDLSYLYLIESGYCFQINGKYLFVFYFKCTLFMWREKKRSHIRIDIWKIK